MNTFACFLFLLAISLSAQKSEFEIDFENMLKTVRLENDRTLKDCTENCKEEKEAECKCRSFTCSVKTSLIECIKKGLGDLKLTQTENIILRLKAKNLDIESQEQRILRDKKLAGTISPKCFLDYIMNLYQKANAENSG